MATDAKPKAPAFSAALAEDVALDEALKVQLLELEALLPSADLFTLLGIEKGADEAVAKAAFFKFSRRLHPDKYFRKKLGSFKVRLEKVFRALSSAHQTLTDPAKREAYLAAHPELRKQVVAPPVPVKLPPMKRLAWNSKDFPVAPVDPAAKRGK